MGEVADLATESFLPQFDILLLPLCASDESRLPVKSQLHSPSLLESLDTVGITWDMASLQNVPRSFCFAEKQNIPMLR